MAKRYKRGNSLEPEFMSVSAGTLILGQPVLFTLLAGRVCVELTSDIEIVFSKQNVDPSSGQ
jgi:hypothetical protein